VSKGDVATAVGCGLDDDYFLATTKDTYDFWKTGLNSNASCAAIDLDCSVHSITMISFMSIANGYFAQTYQVASSTYRHYWKNIPPSLKSPLDKAINHSSMIPRYLSTNRSGGYVIGWDDGTVESEAIGDDLKKLIEDGSKYGGVRSIQLSLHNSTSFFLEYENGKIMYRLPQDWHDVMEGHENLVSPNPQL